MNITVTAKAIRPAGPQDACFYCRQKILCDHLDDCVLLKKRVRVRYVYELEIEVPVCWDKDDLESHRNESSWCADNSIDDLKSFIEQGENCLCTVFRCEHLEDGEHLGERA